MSWQEELRRLDEELAAGRLSADDYRARRDQVLSSAVAHGESDSGGATAGSSSGWAGRPSTDGPGVDEAAQAPEGGQPAQQPQGTSQQGGAGQQGGGQQGGADATQIISPVDPAQGPPQGATQQTPPPQAPSQPAPSQQDSPAQSEESTQVVPGHDPNAERTQAVPAWQTQQPADPNRTQIVSSQHTQVGQQPTQHSPSSPPGGVPQAGQQQGQPWNAPEADLSPPWGGSEFPPIAPSASSEWVRQGPEVFTDKPQKRSTGKITAIALATVIVLGGLVVGGYFLFSTGDNQQPNAGDPSQAPAPPPPATSQPSTPSTSTTPANPNQPLLEKLPEPPGKQDPKNGLLAVNDLSALGILDQGEADVLGTRSVDEVAWRGSVKQPDESGPQADKFSVMVVPVDNASTAAGLVDQLRQYQENNGLVRIPEPLGDIPAKVALHKTTQVPWDYRGTWVSGTNVLRVGVTPESGEDEAAVSGSYQRVVKSTLETFPATE